MKAKSKELNVIAMNMAKDVGRPSELDNPETSIKIRELILEGLNDVEICSQLGIPEQTFKGWKMNNYNTFADRYQTWKHEYMLKIAEINLTRFMQSDDEKIAQDTSKFIAETLGKKKYSKRLDSDITSNGKTIIPILGGVSTNEIHTDDSTQENS